jgi:hypothetical protein
VDEEHQRGGDDYHEKEQVRTGMNEPLSKENEEATCEYLKTPTTGGDKLLLLVACSLLIWTESHKHHNAL